MLIDQLFSEGQIVEKQVADLLVSQITLQAMLDVLEVGHCSDITRHFLLSHLSVPYELTLDHSLHWVTLVPGHGIVCRLQFLRVDLQGRARRTQNSARAACIREDALRDAAIEVMGVEMDRGLVCSISR